MQEENSGEDKPGWSFNSETEGSADNTQYAAEASVLSWTASEYIAHQHGAGWYLALTAGTAVITALLYVSTKSIFSASVMPVLGIIVGVFASRQPRQVSYELDRKGITIAGRFYPYNSFKSFSIIDEGGIPSVFLSPLKRFMPPISAYFDPKQGDNILKTLGDYLPFEQRQPDFTERLTHRLRF